MVDMHVHLLAGLDDGPKTMEDALEMCRVMASEGVRHTVALAHQNPDYPEVTPDRIRSSVALLKDALREAEINLTVYPCAEVMVYPEIDQGWKQNELMSVADRKTHILLEFPHNQFFDLGPIVRQLRKMNVTPILAHAERIPEWLSDTKAIEALIQQGALVQISSGAVANPTNREMEKILKSWVTRGIAHLIGSDGHSPRKRTPHNKAACQKIRDWAGDLIADRLCHNHGMAILNGQPFKTPPIQVEKKGWFSKLFS